MPGKLAKNGDHKKEIEDTLITLKAVRVVHTLGTVTAHSWPSRTALTSDPPRAAAAFSAASSFAAAVFRAASSLTNAIFLAASSLTWAIFLAATSEVIMGFSTSATDVIFAAPFTPAKDSTKLLLATLASDLGIAPLPTGGGLGPELGALGVGTLLTEPGDRRLRLPLTWAMARMTTAPLAVMSAAVELPAAA